MAETLFTDILLKITQGPPVPKNKIIEIKKRFPEADFSKSKFGFKKGDPKYDQARNIVRAEQRSAKAKTPEAQAQRRKLQNLAYQDPEKRKKILAKNRKYTGKPEVQERRSKQQKKMYYEGGKREKDLARLRGVVIKQGYGGALINPDNAIIRDMIRAARQGNADLKIIRGGPKNAVVGIKEGSKIYSVVGANKKPLPNAPKNSIPITKHPQFKKRENLIKKIKQFKFTKVPNQNITYGEALDILEARKMGSNPMNRSAAEYEHTKGVKQDYKKGQIATRSSNIEKKKVLTALDTKNITKLEADKKLKRLGVRAFVKGKYIGAPKIDVDKQMTDLRKYVDRKITTIDKVSKPSMIKGAFKAAKPVLKALPLVGTALGVYDVGKAVQAGITDPRDLFAAYQVSADVAAKNKLMREDPEFRKKELAGLPSIMTEDEVEYKQGGFTSYFNGGIVAAKGVK